MADPKRLEAHSSAVIAEEPQAAACQFCGFSDSIASCRLQFGSEDPGSPCCRLCAGVQALGRPTIDHEAALIWAPFLSQAALNRMVRGLQIAMVEGGGSPRPDDAARPGSDDQSRTARLLYRQLLASSEPVVRRLGSSRPSVLAEALTGLAAAALASRTGKESGIRVLHLGRHFRAGEDVYPSIVRAWASARPEKR